MTPELLDLPPPAALDSERDLIAGALILGRMNPDIALEPRHFYREENQTLWRVMSEMDGEHGAFDTTMLLNNLQIADKPPGFDWAPYIAELLTNHTSPSTAPYHVAQVRQAYSRRIIGNEAVELFQASRNGGITAEELRDRFDRLTELTADDEANTRHALPAIEDACDFCQTKLLLPEEQIQGVLHRASKLLIGGTSKGKKTWAQMDMGLSVAYGAPWMDIETSETRVLYVNLELQSAFAGRRLKALAEAKGIVQRPDRFDVWNLRGFATCYAEIFPRILDQIADRNYGLIILDPIYKLYGGEDNENGAREMAALMNSIEHLAVETGAAVAFGAHYSKGNQAAKETIDRVSGSGVFARDPDSLLNFTRHKEEDCYTVETTLRNFPPLDPFVVRWEYPLFHRDASLDPAALKAPGKSQADRAAEQEQQEDEHRSRLLKALRATSSGETAKALRITTGLNSANFNKAIASLLQEGRAEQCRFKKYNRMEDGFKPTGK